MASAAEILQFEHADLLISKQKLERARGIEVVRIKREQRKQGSVLQLTAIRALWTACPAPAEGSAPLREEEWEVHPSDHRTSRVRGALRAGPPSTDLSGDPGGAAEKSDHPIPNRGGNAGELRNAHRRKGVSQARRRIRADLWRDDLLRNRHHQWPSNHGSAVPIQFHAGSADLVQPRSRPKSAVGGIRERDRTQRRVLPRTDLVPGSERPRCSESPRRIASRPGLFMWLSYRCFTAKGEETIPLFGYFGLANQIGTTDYSRPRRSERWSISG